MIIEIPNSINNIDMFLNKYLSNVSVLDNIIPILQKNLDSILNNIVNILSNISSDLFIYILSITSLFFNLLMGFILSIYILYDKEHIILSFKKLLYALVSKKRALEIIEFFNISNKIFYHYIIGQLINSIIIGILAFIGFKFIIHIKSSLFLSFIVSITNMIPYFGPFIGAVLPILMTLVYSPIKSLWVAFFILILQQIDGNILGPKIMGDCVGLSPLWIICAVLIGGSLFGFIGVFLSVPIAAIIKIYIDKYIDKNSNTKDSE
ncbi:AI-2E family transporter [Paraclostridium sp.]|uniref:AI-2E family transporter n=1 Tax=Paraclostridium sp. TaxID=2023273 RepID=UPI003F675188